MFSVNKNNYYLLDFLTTTRFFLFSKFQLMLAVLIF